MATEIEYEEYLLSQQWQDKRAVKLRAHPACQLCSFPYELNVCHLTYERLGDERDEDLVVLCRSCHSRHHFIETLTKLPELKDMLGIDAGEMAMKMFSQVAIARGKNLEREMELKQRRQDIADSED